MDLPGLCGRLRAARMDCLVSAVRVPRRTVPELASGLVSNPGVNTVHQIGAALAQLESGPDNLEQGLLQGFATGGFPTLHKACTKPCREKGGSMNTQRRLRSEKREGAPAIGNDPEEPLWRCQHDLAVTGAQVVRLAVLQFRRVFHAYTVPHDETMIAALPSAGTRLRLVPPMSWRAKFIVDDEFGEATADAAVLGASKLAVNAKNLFEAYGDLRQILRRRRDAAKGGA